MSDTVVLLVGHGSREDPGNAEFLRFCEAVRPHLGHEPVETCFIELATPCVPESLDLRAPRGPTSRAGGPSRAVALTPPIGQQKPVPQH